MAIWKLEPTDLNSTDWEYSTYQGEVIVRAESEIKAREITARAYVVMAKVKTGARKSNDIPWNQPSLVSATTIRDGNYQEIGREEVVGPPEALQKIDAQLAYMGSSWLVVPTHRSPASLAVRHQKERPHWGELVRLKSV